MIARVPFQHRLHALRGGQQIVLLPQTIGNTSHHLVARAGLPVTQTEIGLVTQWIVAGRIANPILIPHGRRGTAKPLEKVSLIACPQCKKPCQRIAAKQGNEPHCSRILPDETRKEFLQDEMERVRSPITKRSMAEDRRHAPGRELRTPIFDFQGDKQEALRGLVDEAGFKGQRGLVMPVDRLDKKESGTGRAQNGAPPAPDCGVMDV